MASMSFIDGAPLVVGLRVKVKAFGQSDKAGIITQVERNPGAMPWDEVVTYLKGTLDDGELFECNESNVSVEAIGRNRTRTLD